MGRVSRDARLLFIELWTYADDYGRARASPRMLAGVLFPFDDDATSLLEGWLRELEREECIYLYAINGSSYLQIVNWSKHQRVDKPTQSKIPPPPDEFANIREASLNIREMSNQEREGEEERDQDQDPPGSARAREEGTQKSSFETECRRRVGQEPVALAVDFHEITALLDAGVTEADVFRGIDAAMATRDFRPRAWAKLAGWARRAAKDRLMAAEKPAVSQRFARAGPRRVDRKSIFEIAAELVEMDHATRGESRPPGRADAVDPGAGPEVFGVPFGACQPRFSDVLDLRRSSADAFG